LEPCEAGPYELEPYEPGRECEPGEPEPPNIGEPDEPDEMDEPEPDEMEPRHDKNKYESDEPAKPG